MTTLAWRDLPLMGYAWFTVILAWTAAVGATPARTDLLATAIFPLAAVWIVTALRWPGGSLQEHRFALTLSVGAPLLVMLIGVSGLRAPETDAALLRIHEVATICLGLLCVAHAAWRGRAHAALLLPVTLYGAALENGGILLGFFREPGYTLYVGPLPAPVSTVAGWMVAFYLCNWMTEQVRERVDAVRHSAVASALTAVAAALAIDLQIDPLASAIDLWHWHPMLPIGALGVPAVNWVAWLCAVFPFALLLYRGGGDPPDAWRMLWQAPLALLLASVMFLTGMALLEGGTDGPTFDILREAWGRWSQVR